MAPLPGKVAFRLTWTYYYSLVDIFLILLCFIVFDLCRTNLLVWQIHGEEENPCFPKITNWIIHCATCIETWILMMMIQTRTFQLRLMFMVSCYPMLRVNTKRGDKIPFHGPQAYYRGYDNIVDSDGPLVLPPLPTGHTFVVTSSLMQMLTARGLFPGLPYEDPHAHVVV